MKWGGKCARLEKEIKCTEVDVKAWLGRDILGCEFNVSHFKKMSLCIIIKTFGFSLL